MWEGLDPYGTGYINVAQLTALITSVRACTPAVHRTYEHMPPQVPSTNVLTADVHALCVYTCTRVLRQMSVHAATLGAPLCTSALLEP